MGFSRQEYWSGVPLPSPMTIQGLFPLGLTGLIFLSSKGLSRVFSNTRKFEGINSSALNLLYGPTLTSVRDYWENRSFDYTDLCRQSNVPTQVEDGNFSLSTSIWSQTGWN